MSKPRQYTEAETREMFLKHVWEIVEYWQALPGKTEKEKMAGEAFSILSMIDGCQVDICGFIVAPYPHPNDKEYRIEQGRNYFAENHMVDVTSDIAGTLHELFYNHQPDGWDV